MLSLAHQVATDLDRAAGLDLLDHSWLEDEDAEDVLDLERYRVRSGQTVLRLPVIQARDLPTGSRFDDVLQRNG